MITRFKAPTWWAIALTVVFIASSLLPSVTFFSEPQHYLPLHTALEFLSMAISLMVFALAWNLRHIEDNSQIVLVGVFSLSIVIIDLAHTFSYAGMPVLVTESSTSKAIYFWLAGRTLAALAFLLVAVLPVRHWRVRVWIPLTVGTLLAVAVVLWIGLFHLDWVPETFVAGQGLTTFKIVSEYLVAGLYAAAALILMARSARRTGIDYRWLATAAWTLALAELFFTLYTNPTDVFNLLGHVYKATAYLMVYVAIFASGVHEPYRQLAREQARLRSLIDSLPDLITFKDRHGNYAGANHAFIAFTGIPEDALVGQSPAALSGVRPGSQAADRDAKVFSDGGTLRYEEWIAKGDGGGAVFDTLETSFSAPGEPVAGLIEVSRDITDIKRSEERIHQLAMYDQLTGLPNRLLLRETVDAALALQAPGVIALLSLDLDDFKAVNDTFGHDIGDLLLQQTGQRILQQATGQNVVARLGNDEFALLASVGDEDAATALAERIVAALSEPFQVEHYALSMSVSIGVALGPKDGATFDDLAHSADAALNRAKSEGRNAIRVYSEEMQAQSALRMQMLTYLRRAIERDELVLHYQPQVSFETGEIVGAEALLRWQHPDLGLLAPDSFIPIAEDSGLILGIGNWVLHRALADASEWSTSGALRPSVAVNISAVEFLQNDLPNRIAGALEATGFPADRLELEITETVAMRNPDAAAGMIDRLRGLGVQMAIDDFGTGYSSMAYLKRFRIDKIKIDASFVRDLGRGPDDDAIVRAIVQMARSLHCTTIAEGVENDLQRTHLIACDCDQMQGFYFSRPVPQEELLSLLARERQTVGQPVRETT